MLTLLSIEVGALMGEAFITQQKLGLEISNIAGRNVGKGGYKKDGVGHLIATGLIN